MSPNYTILIKFIQNFKRTSIGKETRLIYTQLRNHVIMARVKPRNLVLQVTNSPTDRQGSNLYETNLEFIIVVNEGNKKASLLVLHNSAINIYFVNV
jgi:hypothetical protein